MRDTFLRLLSDDERNMLYDMIQDDEESSYRAKIILLKDEEYTVPEIRRAINHHDINIRKWIHRFNEQGVEGIMSKLHKHRSIKLTVEIEKKIVEIASKNPREGYGLSTLLNLVIKGTGRICIKGTRPCGFYKSHRD
jgi:transposase